MPNVVFKFEVKEFRQATDIDKVINNTHCLG